MKRSRPPKRREGYVSARAFAIMHGMNPETVRNAAHAGRIPGAIFEVRENRTRGEWSIPEDAPGPERANPGDLDTNQVARMLNRSESTINWWCREGRMPGAYKVGQHWYVPLASARVPERKIWGATYPRLKEVSQ